MKKILCIGLALLVSAFATPFANADAFIQGFTGGGGPFSSFYGTSAAAGGDVVGYRFTADENGFITALGVTNATDNTLLNGAHMVGVWRNSDMALLGSINVDPASGTIFSDNGWFYENVTPIALTAGEGYTLGAAYSADDGDTYISGPTTLDLMHISGTTAVFPDAGDLGFIYPGSESPGNLGRIGPNAIFEPSMVIPEPASAGVLCLAMVGLIARRRK